MLISTSKYDTIFLDSDVSEVDIFEEVFKFWIIDTDEVVSIARC